MAVLQRRVRHLRLVARSQAAVRAALPRLEDALRCASLPDAGARLLLVRRLVLGPLERQASSQTIAHAIEAQFADRSVPWTAGEETDALTAQRVVFASAWHARLALSLRLLRRQPCAAWYWPLAVPEFCSGTDLGGNLRAIACAQAQCDEASVALPAWTTQIARELGPPVLLAALPESLGNALVAAVGLAPLAANKSLAEAPGGIQSAGPWPAWLQTLLHAGGWREYMRMEGSQKPAQGIRRHAASKSGADRIRFDAGPHETVAAEKSRQAGTTRGHAARNNAAEQTAGRNAGTTLPLADRAAFALPPQRRVSGAASTQAAAGSGSVTENPAGAMAGHIAQPCAGISAAPTAYGGLLFLLPVLARLGLPAWAEGAAGDPAAWTRAVLASVLVRLRAPADDPMWALVRKTEPLLRHDAPAPAAWRDPAAIPWLASPMATAPGRRESTIAAALPQALEAAPSSAAQAEVWRTAVRRWLRRAARTSLANVVLRPGWVGITPTHADLFFRQDAADLRIRRLGLDIDPGWVPWFGRVVAYHYGGEPYAL